MRRRQATLLIGGTLLLTAARMGAPVTALATERPPDMQTYLGPHGFIDSDAPSIRDAAAAAIAGARGDRERAIRIHDFVRDDVRFGWAPAFYEMSASDVLAAGVGYCNTKSTLFVALLRAAGIPARQVFVDISARILGGLIDPGTAYVDHSYTEVRLDGRWIKLDSYIVDQPLFDRASERLRHEDRMLGYGVHVDGQCDWDGDGDSFAQFVDNGRVPDLTSRRYGRYADVAAFYAYEDGWNEKSLVSDIAFRLFVGGANRNIARLRES